MDDHICTVNNRAYRLHATGQQLAGGRHTYALLDGPTLAARRIMWVERCWLPGRAKDGTPIPVWGWRWQGVWYATDTAVVRAVLGLAQAA